MRKDKEMYFSDRFFCNVKQKTDLGDSGSIHANLFSH